ncbi:MAG: porin [Gammaproteobacteria bacterium]
MTTKQSQQAFRILPLAGCVLFAIGGTPALAADPVPGGPAAQVYGQARLHLLNRSDDFGTAGNGTALQSYASRIGVKGSFPTGIENVEAFYTLEMLYDTSDAIDDSDLRGRDAFAGLRGSFGSVKAGRLSTAYKSTLTKIDPWNDSEMQSRGFGGRQGSSALHSSYFNKAIEYATPKFNGVTLAGWASLQFDDTNARLHNAGPLTAYEGGSASGLGVKYENDSLFVGADLIDIDADTITNANLANDTGYQIAGRYKMGAFSVAALYEDVEDIGLGKNTWFNVIYKQGAMRYTAGYGMNRDALRFNNEDIDTFNIGAIYNLNKTSELFAAYNHRSEDNANLDFKTFTVGMNLKFGY